MEAWLETSLKEISRVRATVFGDFCLDAYWFLDQSETETSIETGLPVRRVREQRYALGGAGSVADNLIDLGVRSVCAIGMAGDDVFGAALVALLRARGINLNGFQVAGGVQTMVYAKPYLGDEEQSRIDFGAFNGVSQSLRGSLIEHLRAATKDSDVIVLNQQVPNGLSDECTIERINAIIAEYPDRIFLVDSRHFASTYRGAILKLNTEEAARFLQETVDDVVSREKESELVSRISAKTGKPVFLTRGDRGLLVAADGIVSGVNGLQVAGRTDSVGAGDAVVAALGAALGSGQDAVTAANLANVVAMVTVGKLRQTGTASRDEILEAGRDLNYIFEPELADSPQLAKKIPGTEIEIVGELPGDLAIRHCIFDHDGTLSSLREGWEKIMESMMIEAVFGRQSDRPDSGAYGRVQQMVRDLIDRTTGAPTLAQMAELKKLVRHAGFIPESEIFDEHDYKRIFNEKLLQMVCARRDKLASGELNPADFQIRNAGLLLQALHERGVKLYLASGTDVADVIAEAEVLGYAHLFEGEIFGATGDANVEAKRMVLDRIIAEHDLAGHQFATFGDGPVEMRETRRRGGLCIGVAGDEARGGWNMNKRRRLIRAGAKILVPDFSEFPALMKVMQLA